MLTEDLLKNQETLKGLSDEQLKVIAELSKNDENTVIAQKVREIHDRYDQDIKEVTGIDKPLTKKSYEHLKEVLSEYKKGLDGNSGMKDTLEKLKSEKAELEKQLKSGTGNEALSKKVEEYESQIKTLRADLDTMVKNHSEQLEAKEKENFNFRLESIQKQKLAGLKFKPDLDDYTVNAVRKNALQEVMSMGTPTIEKIGEDETIVFRDDKGMLIVDDNNMKKPLTFEDAYKQKVSHLLDSKREVKGVNVKGKSKPSANLDGNWSTKTEAIDSIRKNLLERGIAPGSEKFQEEQNKLYKELEIGNLPM